MEFIFILIPLAIMAAIAFRVGAGSMDRDRISSYIQESGGRIVAINWAPFGPGWFGEKSDRIYRVRYFDRDGNEHEAHCKTSMLTGVYLTEDTITRHAQGKLAFAVPSETTALEQENQRLREELARLRQQQRDGRG